jgi:hypothetical protein
VPQITAKATIEVAVQAAVTVTVTVTVTIAIANRDSSQLSLNERLDGGISERVGIFTRRFVVLRSLRTVEQVHALTRIAAKQQQQHVAAKQQQQHVEHRQKQKQSQTRPTMTCNDYPTLTSP